MDSLYSRYAGALLSIAIEENKIEVYRNKIKVWKNLIMENQDLIHLFSSYFISKEEKEQIIDQLFVDEEENIKNFIKVIVQNKRANSILKIFDEFISECNEKLEISEGIVYSVEKLSKEQLDALEKNLSIRLNSKVELVNLIDERLIGGLKVVVKDKIFDGSIKNKLEKLKESLM